MKKTKTLRKWKRINDIQISRGEGIHEGYSVAHKGFKKKMKDEFIPLLEKMVDREEKYLFYLSNINASTEMIENSKQYLLHYQEKLKEYIDYYGKIV